MPKEHEEKFFVDDCPFCKIVQGEIQARIIAQNEYAVAFLDIEPISEGHTLVIPKKHFIDLGLCDPEYLGGVIGLVQSVGRIIDESKLGAWGINYLSNQGAVAGQKVNHFHFHVIPKYAKGEGLEFSADKRYFEHELDEVQQLLVKSAQKMEKGGGIFPRFSDKIYGNKK